MSVFSFPISDSKQTRKVKNEFSHFSFASHFQESKYALRSRKQAKGMHHHTYYPSICILREFTNFWLWLHSLCLQSYIQFQLLQLDFHCVVWLDCNSDKTLGQPQLFLLLEMEDTFVRRTLKTFINCSQCRRRNAHFKPSSSNTTSKTICYSIQKLHCWNPKSVEQINSFNLYLGLYVIHECLLSLQMDMTEVYHQNFQVPYQSGIRKQIN